MLYVELPNGRQYLLKAALIQEGSGINAADFGYLFAETK